MWLTNRWRTAHQCFSTSCSLTIPYNYWKIYYLFKVLISFTGYPSFLLCSCVITEDGSKYKGFVDAFLTILRTVSKTYLLSCACLWFCDFIFCLTDSLSFSLSQTLPARKSVCRRGCSPSGLDSARTICAPHPTRWSFSWSASRSTESTNRRFCHSSLPGTAHVE